MGIFFFFYSKSKQFDWIATPIFRATHSFTYWFLSLMMIKNKTDSCVLFSYLPLNASASLWCLSRVYTPQLTPTEGLPLWKHRPLCMWNQRVQHSSIHRMNNEPDSCRNNPLSPTGRVQTYPRFQGSCLPQGGQSESLWCQQAEQPADPQSRCPSAPVELHGCENRGLSWMNRSPSLAG